MGYLTPPSRKVPRGERSILPGSMFLILNNHMLKVDCYTCKQVQVFEDETLFPFCSQDCKEQWALTHPIRKVVDDRPVYSIHEMQERLKQMGKEAKVK